MNMCDACLERHADEMYRFEEEQQEYAAGLGAEPAPPEPKP
jgi:hypothetical protein